MRLGACRTSYHHPECQENVTSFLFFPAGQGVTSYLWPSVSPTWICDCPGLGSACQESPLPPPSDDEISSSPSSIPRFRFPPLVLAPARFLSNLPGGSSATRSENQGQQVRAGRPPAWLFSVSSQSPRMHFKVKDFSCYPTPIACSAAVITRAS